MLEALGATLHAAHGIAFRVIEADLTEPGATARVVAETSDLDVGLYISNAGVVGSIAGFLDTPLEQNLAMMQMNVQNLACALHGFGRRMRLRQRGGIVVMSSGTAFCGLPFYASYAATKAFGVVFAESLWGELRDDGVDVLAVAAPAIDTPTMRRGRAGQEIDPENYFTAAAVAQAALARLGQDPVIAFDQPGGQETAAEIEHARRNRLDASLAWAKGYIAAQTGQLR